MALKDNVVFNGRLQEGLYLKWDHFDGQEELIKTVIETDEDGKETVVEVEPYKVYHMTIHLGFYSDSTLTDLWERKPYTVTFDKPSFTYEEGYNQLKEKYFPNAIDC